MAICERWGPLRKAQFGSLNNCSIGAEMLYTRILARCDCNGSYFATPEKINGRLFESRHINGETSPSIIEEWIDELENNGLIVVFSDGGEEYLNIVGVFSSRDNEVKAEFPIPDFLEEVLASRESNDAGLQARNRAADRITDYINETAKKYNVSFSYRHSKTSRNVIIPRMRDDGYVEYDLKLVVEHKCMEWLGDDKMMGFVRPITLFRASKFEGYLNSARAWAAGGKRQKGGLYRGQESKDDYGAVVR